MAGLSVYLAAAGISAVGWFGLGLLTGCLGMCTRGDAWERLWGEMRWWIPAVAVIPAVVFWQRFGKDEI